jgi:hypothetical protein
MDGGRTRASLPMDPRDLVRYGRTVDVRSAGGDDQTGVAVAIEDGCPGLELR